MNLCIIQKDHIAIFTFSLYFRYSSRRVRAGAGNRESRARSGSCHRSGSGGCGLRRSNIPSVETQANV